ncbi:13916_t:CDS:10 [Funneliformis geosporum]|uniref:13916_t:CDS:1 n=1 Tax=Funneliformis geosporum TaxID=1117311 RepID=A0A9W4SHL0_9GLOM|nr:13916_t:CDS:10 [Funneliformis geosporum]
MDVNNELPTIITSEVPVGSLAVPDVAISFDNPFHIYCTFTWTYNEGYHRTENETCINYVTSPQFIQGAYRGYFSLTDNSTLFTFPKLNEERLESLALTVVVDDPNFNASKFNPTPPYAFIFDSENNPLKLSDGTLNLTVLNVSQSTNYERELLFSNWFVMPDRLLNFVQFTKYKRKSIIPSWRSNFGMFLNYEDYTYIKALLNQIFPLDIEEVQTEDYIGIIQVRPNSFVNVIETEQRSRTYVSIFGVIGGAWGLASAFLFGASSIQPWGFVQSRCCGIKRKTQSKLRDSLSILPLIDSSLSDRKSMAKEITMGEMMEKLKSLETLLREYVIDIKYLQSIEKRSSNKEI